MKKLFYTLLITLTFFALTACGETKKADKVSPTDLSPQNSSASQAQSTAEKKQTASEPVSGADDIDIDLTALSSTMVYSEVYNMMYTPDKYIGKTIKMKGQFSYYEDPETKKQYFSCIIADATACCSQGIEFVLTGKHDYPNDYPKINSEITVAGTFHVYEENGYKYCQLANAVLSK